MCCAVLLKKKRSSSKAPELRARTHGPCPAGSTAVQCRLGLQCRCYLFTTCALPSSKTKQEIALCHPISNLPEPSGRQHRRRLQTSECLGTSVDQFEIFMGIDKKQLPAVHLWPGHSITVCTVWSPLLYTDFFPRKDQMPYMLSITYLKTPLRN